VSQETTKPDPTPKDDKPSEVAKEPVPKERCWTTQHEITVGRQRLAYSAEARTTLLRDEEHEPRALVFTTTYLLWGVKDPSRRPLTFCFNGGPGSSSVWLHLGMLGPKRVAFDEPSQPPPPPYELVPSIETILPYTDLVFVDPVGTGLSRPVGKAKLEDFASIKTDVESMAELVTRMVTQLARWNAPKVILGESYGGTRVGALAPLLQDAGMMLSAAVLVSPALDFSSIDPAPGNVLPNVLYLPGYAATAAYHGAIPVSAKALPKFLAQAREFAVAEYAPALLRGASLGAAERRKVAERLATFTGMEVDWLLARDLHVPQPQFSKELLRKKGRTVGRLDSRFVGHDPDPAAHELAQDPSFSGPLGPYAALLFHYLRSELSVDDERHYRIFNMALNEKWKWEPAKGWTGGFPSVMRDLRRAMLDNPHLEVVFLNGIYDLATPFFASEHAARHLGHEPHVRKNIREHLYPAGHMMYLDPGSRTAMRDDLRAMYERIGKGRAKG
jgi:carboxypeptidase C (cathepsin A)